MLTQVAAILISYIGPGGIYLTWWSLDTSDFQVQLELGDSEETETHNSGEQRNDFLIG